MEVSQDLPGTLDPKTSKGPIYRRYVETVLPWFDSVAKRGSFVSQTLGTDGRAPVIQYCLIPSKGRAKKNVPDIVFVLGWSESFMKYKGEGILRAVVGEYVMQKDGAHWAQLPIHMSCKDGAHLGATANS